MKTLLRSRVLAWVLTVAMVVTFMPSMTFAYTGNATDEATAVAKIVSGDNTYFYDSLRAAVADAGAGDTITLLNDDTTSFTSADNTAIIIDKNLTIDGGNKTIHGVSDGAIQNVTIGATGPDVEFDGTGGTNAHGLFIKSGDVTIQNLNMTEFGDTDYVNKFGIVPILSATNYGGTLTLNNVNIDKFNRQAVCIFGGTLSMTGGVINGNAANKSATEPAKDHFQQPIEVRGGSATISGVTVKGGHEGNAGGAIVIFGNAGDVAITDVTVDGFGGVGIWGDGGNVTVGGNTAVTADPTALFAEEGNVLNITAGNYSGAVAVDSDAASKIIISGGTFSTDVTDFVAEGKGIIKNSDGTWTVNDKYQLTVIANGVTKYDALTTVGTLVTVSDPEVEKVGHTYTGYQSAHYDKFFADGEVYTMPAAADTLTAVYEPNVYTLGYETYDGTIGDPVDSYTYGVGTALPSDVTKEGNTFEGWYSEAEPTYGNLVTEITATDIGDAVFFAKWKEHTYTIHFDPNGGSGQMSNSVNIPYSTEFELPACQFAAPADKQFLEWNTKADGMGQSYTDKAEVSKLTAEDGGVVTLYAIWTAAAYQVRYQATPDATPYANMIYWVEAGAGHVLQNLPTEAGTEANKPKGTWFEGWKIYGDAEGSVYKPDDTIVIDRPTVLMPFWKEFVYSIEYNYDGGELPLGQENPTSYTVSTPEFTLVAPVKEGYEFDGWTWNGNTVPTIGPVTIKGEYMADYVFTANWTAKSYIATYLDTDGSVLDAFNVLCGAEVTKPTTEPAKGGYTFVGWDPEVPEKMPAKNMTFTPQFEKDYTVTYKPNNGGEATEVFTVQAGKTHTVIENPFDPVKEGFEFVIWSTTPSGVGGLWYFVGEEMTVNSDVTLYALWLDNNDYTIRFVANADVYPVTGTPPLPKTGKKGDSFELEAGTLEAEDALNYYWLAGWKEEVLTGLDGPGGAVVHFYSVGDSYTIEGNAVLEAVWQVIPKTKCAVAYYANGGDNAPIDSYSPYFAPDTAIAASGESMTPPEGKAFKGWALTLARAAAGTVDYESGAAIPITEPGVLNLFAVWETIPTYSVAYKKNGGTGGDVPVDQNKYAAGDTVTLSDGNGLYKKSDDDYKYTLAGWTVKGSTSPVYPLGSTFTMSKDVVDPETEGVVFNAYWEKTPVEKYRAYYYLQGGAADPAFNPSAPMLYGQTYTITSTIPVKEGYRFDGWYDWDSEQIFQPGAYIDVPESDIWLVAEWTKVYTLTYDLNGGSWEWTDNTVKGLTGGQTVTLPKANENPTKANYTFAGWKDPATGEVYTSDAFTMPARDTILVAQWEPNVYKVTLHTEGGTINSGDVTEYTYGVETALPTDVTKDGAAFGGWYAAGGETPIAKIEKGWVGPQEFWASWTPLYGVTTAVNNEKAGTVTTDKELYAEGETVTVTVTPNPGYKLTGIPVNDVDLPADAYTSENTATFAKNPQVDHIVANFTGITYKVAFDANAPEGASATSTSEAMNPQENIVYGDSSVKLSPCTYGFVGYTFTGWNTAADGSGTAYADNDVALNMTTEDLSTVTLYAQWSKNETLPTQEMLAAAIAFPYLDSYVYGGVAQQNGTAVDYVIQESNLGGSEPAESKLITDMQRLLGAMHMGGQAQSIEFKGVLYRWDWMSQGWVENNSMIPDIGLVPGADSPSPSTLLITAIQNDIGVNYGDNPDGASIQMKVDGNLVQLNVTVAKDVVPEQDPGTIRITGNGTDAPNGAIPAILLSKADAETVAAVKAAVANSEYGDNWKVAAVVNFDVYYNHQKLSDVMLSKPIQLLIPYGPATTDGVYKAGVLHDGKVIVDEDASGQAKAVKTSGELFSPYFVLIPGDHEVTWNEGEGYQFEGEPAVVDGQNYNFSIITEPGYMVTGVRINNIEKEVPAPVELVGGQNKYGFGIENVKEDQNIAITVEKLYKLTYKADYVTTVPAAAYHHAGDEFAVGDAPNPVKENFTFVGWTDGEDTYKSGDLYKMPAADTVLNAVLEPTMVDVIFDADNGTENVKIQVQRGSKLEKPADPEKEGFDFVSWQSGDTAWNFDTDTVTAEGPVTLKAQWKNSDHTITWANGEGYFFNDNTATSAAVAHEGAYEYTITIEPGYKLIGVKANGVSQTLVAPEDNNGQLVYSFNSTNGNRLTDITKDIELTADVQKTFAATYHPNGATQGGDFTETLSGTVDYKVLGPDNEALKYQKVVDGVTYTFMGWSEDKYGIGPYYDGDDVIEGLDHNLDLYAQWENLNQYKVIYDKGKAPFASKTIEGYPPDVQTAYIDEQVRLAGYWNTDLSIEEDADWYYVQTGWNTKDDGTGTHYRMGQRYTFDTPENLVLFAEWKAVRKTACYIGYDANGGMNAPEDPLSPYDGYIVGQGDAVATVLGPENMTREGYTFKCWAVDQPDETAKEYNPTDKIALEPGLIILRAVWEEVPTYKVKYQLGLDDASGVELPIYVVAPTDSKAYAEGEPVRLADRLPDIPITIEREGTTLMTFGKLVFQYWEVVDSDVDEYYANTTYAMNPQHALENGTVTFKAAWKFVPEELVALRYNLEGGVAPDEPVGAFATDMYNVGDEVTVSTATPTKEGYTLEGWSDGTTFYPAGNKFNITEDTTLSAVWTPAWNLNYVTTNPAAGTSETAVAGPYEAGTNVVVGNKPADVEGYRFVGWEYGDAMYTPGNTFTMPGNDVYLISKWAEVDKYYVSYDSGFGNPIVHEGPYEAESKIYVAGAPTKEGYSFLGWRNGDKLYTANELFTMPAEDVTFTAEWSQNYKVTYYANNGTEETFVDPESTNENYTVRGIGEWTKAVEGRGDQFYTFMGWSTRIDGYGDYYSPSDKIDLTGDLDLYAQWENLNEYTVTYNKGKAPFESKTIVGHAPSDQTGYIDETIRLADSTMFIEGDADWFYVQTGWNTAVDGTGKHYRFGQRYTFDKPEGLVLYAEWQAVRKTDCYIRYDANGGMNAPEDANSPYTGYVQGQGDAFATVLGPEDMTKEGYTFKNWTLDPENAEAPTFNPTDNIALAPGIITLYAQWDKVPTYKVNYKVDGTGENYGVNNPITDSKIYTEGELVRLASGIGLTKDPKVVDDVVVAKYVFAGWLVDGSTVDKYLPGSLYTVNKDHATPNEEVGSDYIVTFVPAWIEVPVDVYVVNYNLNGGSSDSDELKPAEYNSGQTVTVASDTPVKDGYRFDHWDYGDTEYYKGDTFKIEDQDVTLTAHWKKLHSIGFKDDVLSAVEYIAGSFAEGDQIQLNDKPGKANYTFLGWVYDGVTYAAKELFNMVDDDVIFTASWARNYTVTYFANNGTEDFFIETPESNTGYTVSVVPIGWKKSVDDIHQYTFTGWNTQPTGHGDSYTAGEVLTEDLSRDLKLYAQWEDQNVYKVNYHKGKYGDKEIKGALPSSKTGKVGDSFIVAPSDLFIAPDEENFYRFLGWNTNIDGAGDPYYPFMTYTFGAQDVTLFAQWEAIPKTSAYITYNANGGFNAPIDNEVYYANPTAQIRVSGPENMEKPGYTFSHWVDENQKRYDPKDRINLPPGETILYAVWNEIPTYGVSYDTVEGVWGTPPSDSKKYAEGQAVLLPSTADLIKPATDDCTYVLDGWMVANSTSTVYGLGDIYIMNPYDVNEADDKVHFIPHWNEVKIPKLSVVYDFNGGTVPLNVVDQFLGKTYKEGATFYVPSAKPGRTGYQFQGWYNNADGRTYQPNALVNVGDQDITMIAVWEPIYTITYVIVDPSDASHSVRWTEDDPAIYKENEKFWVRHLNEITTGFSDIEHSFTGWKDRAGNEYTPNLDYTMGTSSLVLYAQWDKDYTVKFDLGEVSYLADLSQDKPADQTPVHVGDKVQQVTIPLEYTDENTHVTYYFAGWQWTDKNNNNFNWNFEWPLQQDHFDVNDVMTLTAQWTTTQSYQIIYDACVPIAFKEYLTVEWNGVRVEDLLVPYGTVDRQDTLHLPVGFVAQNAIITADNLAMFTRNSYKFDGWYLTPDCYEGTEYDMTKTVEENDPNGIYRIDNPYDTDLSNGKQKALILYAKWTSTYAEEGVHVADAKLADGTYAVYYEDKVRAISNDKYLDHVERNFIEVDQYGNPMGLQDNGTSRSNLPPGLKLDPLSGKISGVPTVAGTYTFWIELEDEDQGEQFNDPAEITIVINPMKFNADFTGDFWKYYGDLDPAAPKHSNEMKISVGEQTAILDNQNVGTIWLDSDTTVPQTYQKTKVTVTASDENNTVEVRYHTENAIDLVDTFTLPVEREAGENVGKYHMFLDPANISVTNKDTIKDVSANYEITVGEGLDKDKDAGYLEIKPAPFTFELGDSEDKGKTYGQTDSLTSNLIAVNPSPSASGVVSSAANQTLTVTFKNGIVDKLNLGLTRETLKEDAGKYKLYLDEEQIKGIEINGEEGDVNIGNYAFTISEAFSTKALTEATAAKYIYTIAKAILSGTNNAEYVYGEVADTVPLMAEGLVDNADISIKDAVNAVVVGKQFLSTSGHLIVGTFRSTTSDELKIAVTNESYEPDQTTSQDTTANYDSSVTAEVKVTARPLKVQGNDITVHKGETKDVMKERLAGIIGLDTVLEGDDVTPDMTFTYGDKTGVGFDEFVDDIFNTAKDAEESGTIQVAIDVALAGADKDNYTADKTSANVDVSIEIKKNIAGMEITLNPDAPYTYNGEQIKPTVTVIDPDTGEVVPATEYTVEYGPNTNVNDGVKVTITANPDSEIVAGQKKVSETMDKADISPKVSMSNYQEGSVPSIPTVTEGNPGNGSVTYSYKPMSAPDEDYGPNAPTTKGNYTVRAVVGATANYNGGTATANFQVTEKSEPGPGPGPGPGPSPTEEYTITVNKVSNGNAVSDKATAEAGDKVTITTTPAAGYKTVSVRVQDKKGKEVAVTAVDKTTYTFKMPSSDVTVTPYFDKRKPMDDYSTKYKECKHDEECPMYAYSDLKEKLNEWFHDGIHFCLENGIMKGYEDMTFRETLPTTRAELVTMLWNTQGKPDQGKDLSFTDTPSDAWYYDAVRWGVDTKIVNGYEDNTFRPNNPVSRQELAKLLYGFAKANGFDVSDSASIDGFNDRADVGPWAVPYLEWAVGAGLIQGRDGNMLAPTDNASRAEVATIMMRFCVKYTSN